MQQEPRASKWAAGHAIANRRLWLRSAGGCCSGYSNGNPLRSLWQPHGRKNCRDRLGQRKPVGVAHQIVKTHVIEILPEILTDKLPPLFVVDSHASPSLFQGQLPGLTQPPGPNLRGGGYEHAQPVRVVSQRKVGTASHDDRASMRREVNQGSKDARWHPG
jgi:hypothetical protein